ncbi:MAG: hypothetical protein VKM97_07385 [Cyanobacteriota bacterium]|nr:hypothetical protein [Cyanobacteriota bacterium]
MMILPPELTFTAARGNRLRSGTHQLVLKLKQQVADTDEAAMRREIHYAADCLGHAARQAMAALLSGPVFDSDAKRPQGPVLSWIDRLLKAHAKSEQPAAAMVSEGLGGALPGGGGGGDGSLLLPGGGIVGVSRLLHSKAAVASSALTALLESNLDLLPTCIDRCYDADPAISTGYFQVGTA